MSMEIMRCRSRRGNEQQRGNEGGGQRRKQVRNKFEQGHCSFRPPETGRELYGTQKWVGKSFVSSCPVLANNRETSKQNKQGHKWGDKGIPSKHCRYNLRHGFLFQICFIKFISMSGAMFCPSLLGRDVGCICLGALVVVVAIARASDLHIFAPNSAEKCVCRPSVFFSSAKMFLFQLPCAHGSSRPTTVAP